MSVEDFRTNDRLRYIIAGSDRDGELYLELQNLVQMATNRAGFQVGREWEFGWYDAGAVSDGTFDCIAPEGGRGWVDLFDRAKLVESARVNADGYLWAFAYNVTGEKATRADLETSLSTTDVNNESVLVKVFDPGPIDNTETETALADVFEEDDCSGCGSVF